METEIRKSSKSKTLLMTPQGKVLKQKDLARWSTLDQIIIICGQYEGFDERIRCNLITDEISIGDFVLSGGEVPAMVIIDSVSRLLPGVINSSDSAKNDSFYDGLLQYPQYTRPAEYQGMKVPKILLSGNHTEIEKWRRRESLKKTKLQRPDLIELLSLSEEERTFLENI